MPTSTDVSVNVAPSAPASAAAVAIFITEKTTKLGPAADLLDPAEARSAQRLLDAGIAHGKAKEIAADLVDLPRGRHRRVLLVGVGDAKAASAESVRHAAAALQRWLRKQHLSSAAVVVPQELGANQPLGVSAATEAVVTGFLLAAFKFREHKGTASRKKDDDDATPFSLTLLTDRAQIRDAKPAAARAQILADAQNLARTIASRPGNQINPPALANVARQVAREAGLRCRVLDERELRRLGMGGILAVGGASQSPPRLIVLEHRPAAASARKGAPLLIVGKAITFDTGGISIKPADKMGRMIFDKCGGVAVLGIMYAVAKLRLPVPVVGILSSAENMPGGRAYRPGDIIRMYNGVTVEVTNTDAEGRLVLGDALAWGIEKYKPSAAIDLATLTGGVIVALGHTMAGVMSNSDALVRELSTAADSAGEKLWRLPVGDEQREQLKSDPADIVNSAGRDAAPLQGGAFLSHFVPADGAVPWAHLDIAGVADTEKELPLYAKGATGWGVRTVAQWVAARG